MYPHLILRRLAQWACAWMAALASAHAADTPPAVTSTPFDTYRAWRDEPVADWRTSNERVEAAGGWRAYLRESQPDQPDTGEHAHHGHHHH